MSGHFATMVFGDLGAGIIKIDQPEEADNYRQIP
jgi:crotonobetainyl-CoA:carnitine CoA-transferase CaiB-like acyl-CoA transferase